MLESRGSGGTEQDGSVQAAAARGAGQPARVVALGAVITFLLLALLGVVGWGVYSALDTAGDVHALEQTSMRVAILDEATTRAARMAVVRGNPEWVRQYETVGAEIDHATKRLLDRAAATGIRPAAERIREAEMRMARIERAAIGLAFQGEREEALQLLASTGYNQQKEMLTQGVAEIGEAVEGALRASDETVRSRTLAGWVLLVAVVLALTATWLLVFRLIRRYIRDRDRAERELAESEQELSALIRSMDDLVLIFDAGGRYLEVASTSAPLLLPRHQVPGKRLHEVHPPGTADRFLHHIREALATEQTQYLEYQLRIQGEEIWRSAAISPMPGDRVVWVARDITKLKRVETQVEMERAYLRAVLDASPSLVFAKDGEGRFTLANRAVADVYGTTPEGLVGRTDADFNTDAAEVEAFLSADRRVIETGKDLLVDEEPVTCAATGEVRWYQTRKVRLEPPGGGPPQVLGIAADVTERKRAEEALRESEEKFRQLAENIREVFWIASSEISAILYVSPAYEEVTGRTVASVYDRGDFLWTAIHPDDLERVQQARATVAEGEPVEIEFRHRHEDGSLRWLRVRAFPVRDERGEPYRTVATAEDVTERKRVEDERAAAEAHYRRLVTTSPVGIYALDAQGLVTEVNPAVETLIDRPREQVLGRHFGDFVAPEDLPLARRIFEDALAGRSDTFSVEVHLTRPSGERRLVSISAASIVEDGAVVGTHGIAHDVTEERAREEQRRFLARVLDSLADAVAVIDDSGEIVYANVAVSRILGVDPERLPELSLEDFLPDDASRKEAEEIAKVLQQSGQWSGRVWRRRLLDGTLIPLDLVASQVTSGDENGKSYTFALFRDASNEVEIERHLRRAERLASLATLLRGVAHELNNPLHAVRNFADLMLQEERSQDDREALEYIRQEADRAAQVVVDMHRFARQAETEASGRTAIDLNEAVREVLSMHRYALRTGDIELREELARDLAPVHANPREVEQVIFSLLTNAEHAMEKQEEGKRKLIVRTRPSALGAAVEVTDTGPGILPEHLDRVFDPFWTTKAPGEGRGLGLSIAHSIVTEQGGEIRVDSEPGGGARFVVDLPLAPPESVTERSD